MSWPPPQQQLPRAEARPTGRRGRMRVLLPLLGLLLLSGYLFVRYATATAIITATTTAIVSRAMPVPARGTTVSPS